MAIRKFVQRIDGYAHNPSIMAQLPDGLGVGEITCRDRCGRVYTVESAMGSRVLFLDFDCAVDFCSDECIRACCADGGKLADGSQLLLLFRRLPSEYEPNTSIDFIVECEANESQLRGLVYMLAVRWRPPVPPS